MYTYIYELYGFKWFDLQIHLPIVYLYNTCTGQIKAVCFCSTYVPSF